MFRSFALEHPSLFAIGVQRTLPAGSWPTIRPAADRALDVLNAKVTRLADAHMLDGRAVPDATLQFHALCEGLAAVELRSTVPPSALDHIWTEARTALVQGFAAP